MKTRFFYFLYLLIGISVSSVAQNENDKWIFGGSVYPTAPASLNFSSGNPVATTPSSSFYSLEPAATISDYTTGNLLFYSNSEAIYNKLHNIMPNGSGIMGCGSSTQGALIIRKPCNANQYYLFTVDCIENSLTAGLRYNIVDMTLAGGNGDVISGSKNISLWGIRVVEKLTATKHANGRDYWIVAHEWDSNNFLSFLLDSLGISTTPIISSIGAVHTSGNLSILSGEGIGNMCISPDGSRLAEVAGTGAMCANEIFNFNNATGAVTNLISLPCNGLDYGVAISPDNSKLYTTTWNSFPLSGKIYQYDLTSGVAGTINASETIISSGSSGEAFGALQYGKNGKLYVARVLGTSIGVINNPNNAGAACNYVHAGVSLSGRTCRGGLPNNVVHHLDPCLIIVLPVSLASFSAECHENKSIKLSWTTYSEINNDYFIIEKSTNGFDYYETGTVDGSGNSAVLNNYEFYDTEISTRVFYYRLKQVNFNGEFTFSKVISIPGCQSNPGFDFHFVLNGSSLIISSDNPDIESPVNLIVFNSLGQMVFKQPLVFTQESDDNSVKLPRMSTGIYFVQITSRGNSFSGKFFYY